MAKVSRAFEGQGIFVPILKNAHFVFPLGMFLSCPSPADLVRTKQGLIEVALLELWGYFGSFRFLLRGILSSGMPVIGLRNILLDFGRRYLGQCCRFESC